MGGGEADYRTHLNILVDQTLDALVFKSRKILDKCLKLVKEIKISGAKRFKDKRGRAFRLI